MSPDAERAVDDALRHGKALLKTISANDTGLTGSHQAGFYLPKDDEVWPLFTPHGPIKDRLDKSRVQILWPDGRNTASVVTWYGRKTRSEYRLTRFGRAFPWLVHDLVGALLVLVPVSHREFHAHVLDREDDIEDVQAALNVFVLERWAIFLSDRDLDETADACLNRLFRKFALSVAVFPDSRTMSSKARESVLACVRGISQRAADEQLLEYMRAELQLFKMVERKLYQSQVQRLFADIDDFIATALSILNARKARAGRALENHVEELLTKAGLPFEMRALVEGTRPDVLMPGKRAYEDSLRGRYPQEKLIVIGIKTTCKDRWRQVLNEAPHIRRKHILTTQEGISPRQLDEMHRSDVVLVVPEPLHGKYPIERRIKLLGFDEFVASARRLFR